MNGIIKLKNMKKAIIFSLFASMFVGIHAQEKEVDYRRSSIYSLMINHTEQQFASEIKQAFIQIPVPDKFNDHNLSVRVLNLNEKLIGAKSEKENLEITEFLEKNKIAKKSGKDSWNSLSSGQRTNGNPPKEAAGEKKSRESLNSEERCWWRRGGAGEGAAGWGVSGVWTPSRPGMDQGLNLCPLSWQADS